MRYGQPVRIASIMEAPLAEGVLHGRPVICPWHHAVFDVVTGKQLEPPGCGDLQRFPVRVEDGTVWLTVATPPSSEGQRRIHRPAIIG